MDKKKHNIIIGVSGASGAIYAKLLFEKLSKRELQKQTGKVAVVFTKNAGEIWFHELGEKSYHSYPFDYYENNDFYAPMASGSAQFDTMIVCPCSVGTLGRIAAGTADDLLSRAADVTLKERRKLILVIREMPYSLLHIKNMEKITLAGGIICPASPTFYKHPTDINKAALTVVERVLDLAGFTIESERWGEK